MDYLTVFINPKVDRFIPESRIKQANATGNDELN
jgi:hypothetical protein